MSPGRIIRHVEALEGEEVDIKWTLKEGGLYWQRVQIPPKATREVRTQVQTPDPDPDPVQGS